MHSDPLNILLVEDNPGDARLVQIALAESQDSQFNIRHVERLSQALDAIAGHGFAAVLLDLSLPDSHGLETFNQLKAAAPMLPIIILSGLMDEAVALEAVKSGAQDYLVKGQESAYLITRAIRYAIERQHGEEALRQARDDLNNRVEELHRLNQQLQDERNFSNAVVDRAGALVIVLDREGRIRRFNHACEALSGYRFEEVAGRFPWETVLPPEDAETIRVRAFEPLAKNPRNITARYTNHWLTRDGQRRLIDWWNTLLVDADGKFDTMVSIGIDITERRQAEEALQQLNAQLERRVEERTADLMNLNMQLMREVAERKQSEAAQRKSERQLLMITDALPVLVAYVDAEQRYQFNNKAYQDWFGIPREMLLGRSIAEIAGDAAYALIQESVQTALSGSKVNFELALPFLHGGERYVSGSYIPDITPQGEVKGFFALLSDITKVKLAEELQRRNLQQLAHASRLSTTGEMATEIAHEINQPLAAIASYGDTCQRLLASDNYDKDDVQDALQQIIDQAERAGEVIRELRNFVRKDTSNQRTIVDINDVTQEMVGLIQMEADWHQVRIGLQLAERLPPVLANRILIQQVLLNLVRNAIEALADCSNGARQLIIQTRANDEQMVVVSVRDNGPGLPPDQLQQVFEAFHTTKPDGIGMGLAISNSIISAHEGRIWCSNNNDGGSTFAFSLPIASGV